jgi:hypothetical protein
LIRQTQPSTGSTLDISNNTLAIEYGAPAKDPIAAIVGYLSSGFAGGAWTGTGIVSSVAAAQFGKSPTVSVGYADSARDASGPNTIPGLGNASANNIIIRYAEVGDANLDGSVNFADYSILLSNFGKAGTDWAEGNFLYGTGTTFADYSNLLSNFGKALSPPGSSAITDGGAGVIGLSATVHVIPNAPLVPEPASITLLAGGAACLLARRQRRKMN